jgi:putative ABC transport system permease protein
VNSRKLIQRSLVYHWHTNLPIIAGVATAVAVLTGALLVGQSVRGSLRALLYEQIGVTEYVITADRFFSEDLAESFASYMDSCPIIFLKGIVTNEESRIQAHDVNVYGIDRRFWQFQNAGDQTIPEGRSALVGTALAQYLGIHPNDGLLLRVESGQNIPREWLYGRKDNIGKTIRLNCREILPTQQLGEFSLRPSQRSVYSIFVPMERLQRDLGQRSKINAILLARGASAIGPDAINDLLKSSFTLQDLGLRLRPTGVDGGFSVESERIILNESVVQAALDSATELEFRSSLIFSYLANSIRANGKDIPYSVITAADLGKGALSQILAADGRSPQSSFVETDESIWLIDWAQKDLAASIGQPVEVDYYIWLEEGELETHTSRFRLAGVVKAGGDINATLAPEIPGVTDARSMSAWDPPFPLNLSRIRPKDEAYWKQYKATPKAFIPLARGQALWRNRYGKLTALRISLPDGADFESNRQKFAEVFRSRLDPIRIGFAVLGVREQGLSASQGSTDFGEYFIYFSFFLIAAAILLAAMFFRLLIEQRVREIGMLRASGFAIGTMRRLFLFEGLALSLAGSLLGLLGSIGYGWLMVFGLRSWWIGAVGTPRLYLHISWTDLLTGAAIGIFASLGMIAWTLRDLGRNSPRSLLMGNLESPVVKSGRARALGLVSALALAAAVFLLLGSALHIVSPLAGFFGAGFCLLVSSLGAVAYYLRRPRHSAIRGGGWTAFMRLGLRNAMHRPGRSLLCAALIASATFIIISTEAFRQNAENVSLEFSSGTGGYALIAESSLPILYDLNKKEGRESLGASSLDIPETENAAFVSFRERPGDDTSCLNLYTPQDPRILGAPHSFLEAGRFSFQDSLASNREQKRNPWMLLESPSQDSYIPAIADANTIQYIFHLSLGDVITVRGSDGNPVHLRLVASLRDSIFQGELLISESNFRRAFSENDGYRFFLIDIPEKQAESLAQSLKKALDDFGIRVETSRERLAAYHKIENTYLSTFQSLGVLGLILGTIGLATVLLRNVLERRHELALLRAVGYRKRVLSGIIVSENLILVVWGLVTGTICALLSIAPALHERGESFPFAMACLILMAVFSVGLLSSVIAVAAAFRSPLLEALRSE